MSRGNVIRIFWMVLIGGIFLVPGLRASEMDGAVQFITDAFTQYKENYIVTDRRGDIWIAYIDREGSIHLNHTGDGTDLIVNPNRMGGINAFYLEARGDNFYVIWREKSMQEGKMLFLRAIDAEKRRMSDKVLLDGNVTEALDRVKIGSTDEGRVYVEWYGEKPIGDTKYHLYSVCSEDYGKTFTEPVNLTLGYQRSIYPALWVDREKAYTFAYTYKDGKRLFIFRKTLDGCDQWSDPIVIKEVGKVSLFIEPVKVGPRLHLIWFNFIESVPVVEHAYSDDDGETWIHQVLEETRGIDMGLLRVGSDDKKGHLHLVFYGRKGTEKSNVYIKNSYDNGSSWEEITFLRHYPYSHTRAENPTFHIGDEGKIVVVWIDYRNIRSNLYFQYSSDYGKTWQEADIPLEEPGRFNTRHYYLTNSLVKSGDQYTMMAFRYKNDGLRTADIVLMPFRVPE